MQRPPGPDLSGPPRPFDLAPARRRGLLVFEQLGTPSGGVARRELVGDSGGGQMLVVLVHGTLDRAASFNRVLRRLPDLHVLTYDRRGYGGSLEAFREGAGTLADHVDDLLALVGDRPAVAVGHSYGGDIVLAAALAPGSPIQGVGAYEPPLPWMPWWPRQRPASGDAAAGSYAEGFFRIVVGDEAWERLSERARDLRRAEEPALRAELEDLGRPDAPFDASKLEVPAVFGFGGSSIAPHRRAPADLAADAPRSTLVEIPGASHGAHLSHPDAFAELVREVVGASAPSR